MKRVLLIGLDGAPFDYLDPWIAAGELPTLRRLIAQGTRATLRSTPSPYTNVAWPSLVTGLNPGKTGIFDGATRQPGSYQAVPTNLLGHCGEPLWQTVSRHGLRAGVLNVPMTYPPRPLNGYLVPGFDTPRTAANPAYPAGLLDQWTAAGHPYHLLARQAALMDRQNPHQPRGDVDAFLNDWIELTRWQGAFLAWLWQAEPVHFMMAVFTATDSANHRTADRDHLLAVYRAADAALADLLAVGHPALGKDTLVCVVSDHGSTPANWYVSLHRLLAGLGLLSFRREIAGRYLRRGAARLAAPLGSATPKLWARVPSWLRRGLSAVPLARDPRLACAYDNVDWENTTVYARSGMGALYVNRAGREPGGTVGEAEYEAVRQRAIDGLLAVVSPATGEPLFAAVRRGEEVYHGPEMAGAPDLLFTLRDHRHHVLTGFTSDPPVRPIPSDRPYGTHTPDGIFILSGPGVAPGQSLPPADVTDVAPTLLTLMGLPLPAGVDGQPLLGALEPAARQSLEVKAESGAPVEVGQPVGEEFTADEAEDVMERLRALGYL